MSGAMAFTTAIAARRHPPAALALVLVGLLLASSSLTAVRDIFLTARWGGLVALPLVLLWPLPRRIGDVTLELGAVAIAVALALSAVWSIDPQLTLMRAASFGLLLLGLASLLTLSGRAWNPRGFVDAISAVAVVTGVSSLLLWLVRPETAIYVGELRGVLENQNGLGLFLGLTYPFVLAAVERRLARRRLLALLVVPVALIIGLSESRSGALALAAGLVAYELATRFPSRLVVHLVLGVVGILAASLTVGNLNATTHPVPPAQTPSPTVPPVTGSPPSPPPIPSQPPPEERPDILGRGGPAEQSRLAVLLGARNEGWNATADLILARPALGYGFGSGDRVFARFPEKADFVYFQGANPNSGYLQVLLELGFFFGIAILLPFAYAFAVGVRAARKASFAVERAAFLACLVGGLVAALFESLFTAAGAPWALLLWLSAGALLPLGAVRGLSARPGRDARSREGERNDR